MPQACEISDCGSPSLGTCRCCQRCLCREHFVEHDQSIRSALDQLTNELDDLVEQLSRFDLDAVLMDASQSLDRWRFAAYEAIDQFYQRQCMKIHQQIAQLLSTKEQKAEDLREKVIKLVNIQRTTNADLKSLIENLDRLKQQINSIERMSMQINLRPLVMDDSWMTTKISVSLPADLSRLSSPDRSIDRLPLSSDAMISDGQYLLIHQNSHLSLIDADFFVVQEKRWPYECIRDMCWSASLHCFILLTLNSVYLVRANRTLTIEKVETIRGHVWHSCACSETSLYLSADTWNSMIEEFAFLPLTQTFQHRKRHRISHGKQRVDSMTYQNGALALAINDQTKQELCFELRSAETLKCIWSCPLKVEYSERQIQCCLFDQHRWLVADWGTSSLLAINRDGQIDRKEKYAFQINHIAPWISNTLVISTNNTFNFHHL